MSNDLQNIAEHCVDTELHSSRGRAKWQHQEKQRETQQREEWRTDQDLEEQDSGEQWRAVARAGPASWWNGPEPGKKSYQLNGQAKSLLHDSSHDALLIYKPKVFTPIWVSCRSRFEVTWVCKRSELQRGHELKNQVDFPLKPFWESILSLFLRKGPVEARREEAGREARKPAARRRLRGAQTLMSKNGRYYIRSKKLVAPGITSNALCYLYLESQFVPWKMGTVVPFFYGVMSQASKVLG